MSSYSTKIAICLVIDQLGYVDICVHTPAPAQHSGEACLGSEIRYSRSDASVECACRKSSYAQLGTRPVWCQHYVATLSLTGKQCRFQTISLKDLHTINTPQYFL